MKKLKSQSTNRNIDYHKKFVNWQVKVTILKEQINVLEKLSNNMPSISIFPIISFILKTNLIEWELKQLISSLDLCLNFNNQLKYLKRKAITPIEMDNENWTLGRIKHELEKYEGSFLIDLQKNLKALVPLRNKFIHRLFDQGSIDELTKECERSLIVAKEVMENIEEINTFLNAHDPLKKFYRRFYRS